MNKIKKAISILLIILIVLSLFGCVENSGANHNEDKTDAEKAGDFVEYMAVIEYRWYTIGGNTLTYSSAHVTDVSTTGVDEYKVSGKMTMRDVYGDSWIQNFYCYVYKKNGNWDMDEFIYTEDGWLKK